MVSKASDDFPDPDGPVNTISRPRGRSRSTPFRLCCRAPRSTMERVRSAAAAEDRDGADTEAVGGMMGTNNGNASIGRRMPRVPWKFSQSGLRRALIVPLRRGCSMWALIHADGLAVRTQGMRGGGLSCCGTGCAPSGKDESTGRARVDVRLISTLRLLTPIPVLQPV